MIIFKKRIFLKSDKEKEVLLFSYDQDRIYKFEGDCALALKIIDEHKDNDGILKEKLIKELSLRSSEFDTNAFKDETIDEFLKTLNELELLVGKI